MPATTHLNCFKLLVNLATCVNGLKRPGRGTACRSSTEAREIKKFIKTFAMKFWTTIPTSIPSPFFVEPLDAIEISAWPAKAQGILTVATKSLQFELPLIRFFEREEPRLVREDPE